MGRSIGLMCGQETKWGGVGASDEPKKKWNGNYYIIKTEE